MRVEDIKAIVDESVLADDNTVSSLLGIRKKITLLVGAEVVESRLTPKYWEIYLHIAELEYLAFLFASMPFREPTLDLDQASIQMLLELYGRWQKLLDFLVDEFDHGPADFRKRKHKDRLISVAGFVAAMRSRMVADLEHEGKTYVKPSHFRAAERWVSWSRYFILEEDGLVVFVRYLQAALTLVRKFHPSFETFSI